MADKDDKDAVQAAVTGANGLTARWARTWDGGEGTVLSGLGAWPLLAALADAADGPARDELAAAVGLSAHDGLDAARELLGVLNQSPALHTALGLWTAAAVPVNPQWAARLPAAAHNVLDPDPARSQAALDAWVEKETDGLLHRMPIGVSASTLLVLASALTVRTQWERPFDTSPARGTGPWAERGRLLGLHRTTALADCGIRIATTGDGSGSAPVTLATVRGDDEIDVMLALGEPDAHAGTVLATAVAACGPLPQSGPHVDIHPVSLDEPQPGPGLSVVDVRSFDTSPTASLQTVAFTVEAHHDLLRHAELFGLSAASDGSRARFPGISEVPLSVQDAAQDATATFSAEGFVAAAVTGIGMVGSAMPSASAKRLIASFDRPFGFVAAHRPTGLVLVCGWVDDPDDYPTFTG